jgi:hypothetical protein
MWPLWVFFAGFPLAWVLGLGGFITQIAALPMATCLAVAHRSRVPKSIGIWLLFLAWMLLSSVEVSGGSRMLGFAYRASLYLAATITFIYIYNSSPGRLPLTRVCAMATTFLGFVIVGGYIGMVDPHGALTTPFQHVLPSSIVSNALVGKLVHPPFAQGADSTYYHLQPRPAAPFPYTNVWGVNFALLVPFTLAWISATTRRRTRVLLVLMLLVGLVPAAISLNRGMALGLAVGITYAAIRFAGRGNGRALAAVMVAGAVILVVASALHVGARLDHRLNSGSSTDTRTSEYAASYDETLKSPLLGYGAPAPSTVSLNGPQLGTQGQFWTVLYSSGFPGAAFFVLALLGFAWSTRRVRSTAMIWIHTVPIVALSIIIVYAMIGTELVLLMTATALALRDRPPRLVAAPRHAVGRPRELTAAGA